MSDYAVYILTHGRADNVVTYQTLRKCGYTGPIYLVIDDEDEQEAEYRARYGDAVKQFCKQDYIDRSMCINPDKPRKVILYARNACFDIAREMGVERFIEMDDDYNAFYYRYEADGKLKEKVITNLDRVFEAMFTFMEASGAVSVAMSQGGDLIGGVHSKRWCDQLLRKCMNSFFCRTDRPINFVGSINEDVNTYITEGKRGALFFTICKVSLHQAATQSNKGGMTETYLEQGTYAKTFPSVMLNPSCIKVAEMGETGHRIHHRVYWKNAVPRILSEKWRKG